MLGRQKVGSISNAGVGGWSRYDPDADSPFGHRELRALVAASKSSSGQRVTQEEFLNALIEEFQGVERVARAARQGRVALRLRVPLGDDFYIAAAGTADPPPDDDALTRISQELHAERLAENGDGGTPAEEAQTGRWQIWSQHRWVDLPAGPDAHRPADEEEPTDE